jgi:parvulin-like peptidyl-prolyl isomerase
MIMRVGKKTVDQKDLVAELAFLPPATLQRLRRDDNYARIFAVQRFQNAMFVAAAEEEGFVARTPGLKGAAASAAADAIARQYVRGTILPKVRPNQTELEQFYKLNRSLCAEAPSFHFARIVIFLSPKASEKEKDGANDRLEAVRARLKKGDSFSSVADELSDVPSKDGGGDAGWVNEKDLEDDAMGGTVKALSPGGMSDPVKTGRGFEIVKLLESKPARERTLEECKGGLSEKFIEQYARQAVQRRADELVKQLNAALNLDGFIAAARAVPIQPGEEEVKSAIP